MITNIKAFIENIANQIAEYYETQFDNEVKNYSSQMMHDFLAHEYATDLNCIYSSLSMIQSLMEDRQ